MTDKEKLAAISGYVQKAYHESYYDMSNAIADIAKILESESTPLPPSSPHADGAEEVLRELAGIDDEWIAELPTTYRNILTAMRRHAANEVEKAVSDKEKEVEWLKNEVEFYKKALIENCNNA